MCLWKLASRIWKEVWANVVGEEYEYKYSTTPEE